MIGSEFNSLCTFQIWYHINALDDNRKKIKIPNCEEPCLFEQFYGSVENILVRNFTELY